MGWAHSWVGWSWDPRAPGPLPSLPPSSLVTDRRVSMGRSIPSSEHMGQPCPDLKEGGGEKGAGLYHPAWTQRELDKLLGPGTLFTSASEGSCAEICWGSWARNGRGCRRCWPAARQAQACPLQGSSSQVPAAPMPACLPPAGVGPAWLQPSGSLGFSTSAGSWCSLGLMGMDHRQLSCTILGFSHILRGREGSPPLL